MKTLISLPVIFLFFSLTYLHAEALDELQGGHAGWKAGVARVVITPQQSMWMAGYANRDHSSEGTLHELWAKALVLEDAGGKRAVLVTADLLGIPKELSHHIRNQLESKYQLSRAQVILNSSHTHSGPVLQGALLDIYPWTHCSRRKLNNTPVSWLTR
ncbi:neutral/alkaline non-lysosomal ceramidase N-terminal domain-containing protein [Rhodocytophaga rosea]|uniref:neutral/alkaline non-lysosomal ceramidase N-terminal domain-containing protein n=1 Tax=Rhodocytophaga rosea TaxID=2704465 RepID=UPI00293BA705|nr:neutral/alkaline non-lysosomal ceramidase N-terminal domain-containing protein [Rhodocytophaga rosea]